MNVKEAVIGRRNIKQFKPDPIPNEQLMEWLDAASYAPNHRMAQPWDVLVIGPETREKLNHKANFGDAPVVLAIVAHGADTEMDREENLTAAASFVQNFSLVAYEAGVGVRWTSVGGKAENREILGVSEGDVVVGVIGVGYPTDVPAPKTRTPIAEKTRYLP